MSGGSPDIWTINSVSPKYRWCFDWLGLGPLPKIISYHLPPVTNVLQSQPHQSVISILSHIIFGHAPQPNGPNVESVLQRRLADRKAALWFFCSNVFFGSWGLWGDYILHIHRCSVFIGSIPRIPMNLWGHDSTITWWNPNIRPSHPIVGWM